MADLKFTDASASDGEIAAVDAVLGDERGIEHVHERLVRGGTRRRHRLRHMLLPALHALQNDPKMTMRDMTGVKRRAFFAEVIRDVRRRTSAGTFV